MWYLGLESKMVKNMSRKSGNLNKIYKLESTVVHTNVNFLVLSNVPLLC